jgi:hypothetical protein
MVRQLVHRQGQKIHEHDFHHRPQAGHGGPHCSTDDGGLGDRRVAHPLPAEPLEKTTRDAEGSSGSAHVLAQKHHRGILRHRVGESAVDRLPEPDLGHGRASATRE